MNNYKIKTKALTEEDRFYDKLCSPTFLIKAKMLITNLYQFNFINRKDLLVKICINSF